MIVTSSPSRIQVMPSEMTTSQCHRLQGRRSILAGMLVLTGFTADPTLLLTAFIASRLLFSEGGLLLCNSSCKSMARPNTISRIDGYILFSICDSLRNTTVSTWMMLLESALLSPLGQGMHLDRAHG